MKNFDSHIEENDLDNLLRQFVLDGGHDELTQNTLTMNADFIFSNAPLAALDEAQETALIHKLEHAFVKPSGFGKFWLNGFLLIAVLAGIFAIYKFNSAKTSASIQNQNPQNNFVPANISLTDTSQNNSQTTTAISVSQISPLQISSDSAPEIDSAPAEKIIHTRKSGTSNDIIPIERNWYSGNYDVIVPGPTFSAKASPENFKKMQGNFSIDSTHNDNIMFKCKQFSFTSTYYTGDPFKNGMGDFQYFNFGEYAQTAQVEAAKKNLRIQTTLFPWELPWTILEYADTNAVQVVTTNYVYQNQKRSATNIVVNKLPDAGIKLMTEPFYFRKYEVTNKEYREFVNWVRASNGFANKPMYSVQVDTIADTTQRGEKITIKGKQYRIRRKWTLLEDFNTVYNYIFFNSNSEVVKQFGKNSIYVYPDTLSWTDDFTFSYNEPMTNMYFWHPAYDNYPVVGISWYQAQAFLDWKTHFHQQQLDAENIPYEIEYALPSDIEWELASVSLFLGNHNVAFIMGNSATEDWLTNLAVSFPGHDDPYQSANYLKNLFVKDEHFVGDFISDGYFHTGPANLQFAKTDDKSFGTKHLDALGISWMDGNVSEWMQENYSENWKPFFLKHLLVLNADTSESTELAKQIEMLYNKGNAANGKLVRGANWYDERFGGKPGSGRNEAGISPKRFVNPSEQHCTIGFRYVVHVKRK